MTFAPCKSIRDKPKQQAKLRSGQLQLVVACQKQRDKRMHSTCKRVDLYQLRVSRGANHQATSTDLLVHELAEAGRYRLADQEQLRVSAFQSKRNIVASRALAAVDDLKYESSRGLLRKLHTW